MSRGCYSMVGAAPAIPQPPVVVMPPAPKSVWHTVGIGAALAAGAYFLLRAKPVHAWTKKHLRSPFKGEL